jgi:hypothetical protein
MPAHPQKITLGEMRSSGVRGLLIYCADYRCSHSVAISADRWPDDVQLSDLEARFACKVCGKPGADVRPNFNARGPVGGMGYRLKILVAKSRKLRLKAKREMT